MKYEIQDPVGTDVTTKDPSTVVRKLADAEYPNHLTILLLTGRDQEIFRCGYAEFLHGTLSPEKINLRNFDTDNVDRAEE